MDRGRGHGLLAPHGYATASDRFIIRYNSIRLRGKAPVGLLETKIFIGADDYLKLENFHEKIFLI